MRGFYGMAVFHPKKEVNIGSLSRTGNILGMSFFSVIGRRFKPQNSDTIKSYRHTPTYEFTTFDEFFQSLPYGCRLIGVELTESAKDLWTFKHPQQACYLLGAEDHGLPQNVLDKCHEVVRLSGDISLNVAVAGSIVAYHRHNQIGGTV